jgi:Holliday junction resolvase RusA-like endonuclease
MRCAEFLFRVPLMSKARPRSSPRGGRPYMPATYVNWKANLRGQMGEWWTLPPLTKVNVLVLTFSGPARGDLDNLAGAVLDSGNQLIWADDRVNVIHSIVARWKKSKRAESSIYMKIIWEEK